MTLKETPNDRDNHASTWWLYLLSCKDGRTYAGIALDVELRFREHAQGRGAKFTRANKPLAILGAKSFPSKSEALRAEHELKQLSRIERLAWASQHAYQDPPLYRPTSPQVP
jgi:putative endonuclease